MLPKNVIKKAIEIAKESQVARGKVGAVLFTPNGHILAFANNRINRGHPGKWTIHAEEHLIAKATRIRAGSRYSKLCVLVVRWSVESGLTIAKPCPVCSFLLDQTGWKVYYTDRNGQIIEK